MAPGEALTMAPGLPTPHALHGPRPHIQRVLEHSRRSVGGGDKAPVSGGCAGGNTRIRGTTGTWLEILVIKRQIARFRDGVPACRESGPGGSRLVGHFCRSIEPLRRLPTRTATEYTGFIVWAALAGLLRRVPPAADACAGGVAGVGAGPNGDYSIMRARRAGLPTNSYQDSAWRIFRGRTSVPHRLVPHPARCPVPVDIRSRRRAFWCAAAWCAGGRVNGAVRSVPAG